MEIHVALEEELDPEYQDFTDDYVEENAYSSVVHFVVSEQEIALLNQAVSTEEEFIMAYWNIFVGGQFEFIKYAWQNQINLPPTWVIH